MTGRSSPGDGGGRERAREYFNRRILDWDGTFMSSTSQSECSKTEAPAMSTLAVARALHTCSQLRAFASPSWQTSSSSPRVQLETKGISVVHANHIAEVFHTLAHNVMASNLGSTMHDTLVLTNSARSPYQGQTATTTRAVIAKSPHDRAQGCNKMPSLL